MDYGWPMPHNPSNVAILNLLGADSGENERVFREENDRPFRAKTITADRLPKLGAFMIRENLSATKPVQRKEAVGRLELHRLASSYFPTFSFEVCADSPVSSMDF